MTPSGRTKGTPTSGQFTAHLGYSGLADLKHPGEIACRVSLGSASDETAIASRHSPQPARKLDSEVCQIGHTTTRAFPQGVGEQFIGWIVERRQRLNRDAVPSLSDRAQ
jgi:hypothetical protein